MKIILVEKKCDSYYSNQSSEKESAEKLYKLSTIMSLLLQLVTSKFLKVLYKVPIEFVKYILVLFILLVTFIIPLDLE